MSETHKAKQLLVAIIKLLIVSGAFYFIYDRIANDEKLDWVRFIEVLSGKQSTTLIAIILVLTFLNRFLEILKWHNLASYLTPLTIRQATEQVLAAVTTALFTPNGIGEYAAKTLYFAKSQSREVIFLNLICNGIQLIIAVLIGFAGLLIFNGFYNSISFPAIFITLASAAGVGTILFFSRKLAVKGYSIQRLLEKLSNLPKALHRKNMVLAMLRYMVLMHQYYFLLLAFDVDAGYLIMMSAICASYFIGSSLPSFQFLDFAVKGSVALFFFEKLGVNEWIVVLVATLVWVLNTVLPVAIGSYFVFTYTPAKTSLPQE